MVLILCSNHTDEKALFLPLHWFFSLRCHYTSLKKKIPPYILQGPKQMLPSLRSFPYSLRLGWSFFPLRALSHCVHMCTHMSSFLKDKCCVIHYLFIWSLAQFLTYSKHSINVNFYHHQQQNPPCNF